jgi:hypothetical protein
MVDSNKNKVFTIVPEVIGVEMDKSKTYDMLINLFCNKKKIIINVPSKKLLPKVVKADFEKFVDAIKNIFPKYEGEYFALSFKTYTEREIVKKYIEEKEGVKYPSEDLIDFFMEKLKKKKDDPFWAVNFVEVEYEIDTECYSTKGFQNLCKEFIDNYNGNKG